ncbi:MAG TPA: VWA domain-containing protein, partial [Acidobacteriaceae bacterium]
MTIPFRLVPLGRALAIAGLGLFLTLPGRLFAQTTPPALPPASTNQTPESTAAPSTPAAAQQPGVAPQSGAGQSAPGLTPREEPPTETLQLFSREVDLIFTVTDHRGRFVTGLQQQDFGLLDDGRPPSRVVHFKQQTNLPLRVGLMLDTSTSIRQRFQFEQEAATDFFLQVLRPEDRAFVEGFDVQTELSQDFTGRIDLLDTGIRKLRPGGGTALFDSLYKTCRDQMLTLEQDGPVRRAIVLVSDGDDNYSRAYESDAIKMCQRAETTVYTISTNYGPSKDKGDDVLKAIAEATGGQAFFPDSVDQLAT